MSNYLEHFHFSVTNLFLNAENALPIKNKDFKRPFW